MPAYSIEEVAHIRASKNAVIDRQMQEIIRLRKALGSIATNTCCGRCQEAALVAQAALADQVDTI